MNIKTMIALPIFATMVACGGGGGSSAIDTKPVPVVTCGDWTSNGDGTESRTCVEKVDGVTTDKYTETREEPSTGPATTTLSVTVVDGYIVNALVKAGETCDEAYTNSHGAVELTCDASTDFNGLVVTAEAVEGMTYDSDTGEEIDFDLKAEIDAAGNVIVTPATTIGDSQEDAVDHIAHYHETGDALPMVKNVTAVVAVRLDWGLDAGELVDQIVSGNESPETFWAWLKDQNQTAKIELQTYGLFVHMHSIVAGVDHSGGGFANLEERLARYQAYSKVDLANLMIDDGLFYAQSYLGPGEFYCVGGPQGEEYSVERGNADGTCPQDDASSGDRGDNCGDNCGGTQSPVLVGGVPVLGSCAYYHRTNDAGVKYIQALPHGGATDCSWNDKLLFRDWMGWTEAQLNDYHTDDAHWVISDAFQDQWSYSGFYQEAADRLAWYWGE